MAQPDFVPVSPADQVRPADRLPAPGPWRASRPADLAGLRPPEGRSLGSTGPDQGYALKLAHRFSDRLVLEAGEHAEDAVAACLAVALKRAASFGRAPVVHDLEHAYRLFGYLGPAPTDLVEFRRALLAGAGHDYWVQRSAADQVPGATLRLSPAEVAGRAGEWRELLGVAAGG